MFSTRDVAMEKEELNGTPPKAKNRKMLSRGNTTGDKSSIYSGRMSRESQRGGL